MQLFSMFRMRGVDRGALLITATLSGVGNLVCSALFTATPPFLTELYDWDLNAVSYFYAVLAILSSLTVFIFRLANIFPNYRIGMLLGLVIMAVGSIGANSFSKEITPIWRFLVFDLFFAIGYPLLQSFSMMMFIQISGPMYYSLLIPIILGATLFARALGHMLSVVFYDLNPLGDALLYACFFASIFAIALLLVFWPRLVPHRRPPDFDPYQEAVDLSSEAERLDARSTGRAAGSRHDGGTGGSSSGAGSGGGGARVADASDADSRRMSTMSLDSDVGRAWARHSTTTFGSMADPGSGSFTAAGLGNPRAGGRARGVSFLLQHDYSTLDEFGDVGDDFTTNPYTLRPEQQPQPQPQPLPQPQQQEATVAVATAAGDIPGGGASRPVPAARSASDASAATLFGTSLAPGAPAAGPRGSKPAAELSRRSADLLAEAASDQHMALSSWMIDYMSDNEWSDDPDGGRVPPGAGPGDLLQDAYFPGGL
ncbi:hypothetical protein H696_05964 [Fonticula alba]|uniref:Uncharacterized protein n=1 Tax=Fonticula alba TaxID=691883 RepID=A0A058Z0B8_FONAL|nr:hypothetical protein H696_05964 [Fonticula alba]KCV67566.1 hypothetical protein H696_05964 [Fonticula alba]|eukprot:XP_009498007.1 hypothetical protein H696_05964 [Fonticula alba]